MIISLATMDTIAQSVKSGVEKARQEKLASEVASANQKLFNKKMKAKMRSGSQSLRTNDPSKSMDDNSGENLGNVGV